MSRAISYFAVLLLVCGPACLLGQTRPVEPVAASAAEQTSHDHFIGWYRVPARSERLEVRENAPATFIPVFKRDGVYYSVSRFVEVPMTAIPDGLEWGLLPSSMKGTKITYDAQKKQYAITIHDAQEQGDYGVSGLLQPMQKVEAPFTLPDATAKRPQTNEDFVGWYEALWLPQVRYQIRKEGEKFLMEAKIVGRDDMRQPASELQPLADSLGFKMDPRGKSQLIYNQELKRYEIGGGDSVVRIPLQRSEVEPPKDLPERHGVWRVGIWGWN